MTLCVLNESYMIYTSGVLPVLLDVRIYVGSWF